MAKKARHAKKRSKKKRSIPAGRPRQTAPASGPTVAKETAAKLAEEKTAELAEEYRYVYADLKRIAILAGAMLAALIVLSFVFG